MLRKNFAVAVALAAAFSWSSNASAVTMPTLSASKVVSTVSQFDGDGFQVTSCASAKVLENGNMFDPCLDAWDQYYYAAGNVGATQTVYEYCITRPEYALDPTFCDSPLAAYTYWYNQMYLAEVAIICYCYGGCSSYNDEFINEFIDEFIKE